MNNIVAKFQMTTAATVVLLCCFFILSQPVPVQSQIDNADNVVIELNGLSPVSGLTGSGGAGSFLSLLTGGGGGQGSLLGGGGLPTGGVGGLTGAGGGGPLGGAIGGVGGGGLLPSGGFSNVLGGLTSITGGGIPIDANGGVGVAGLGSGGGFRPIPSLVPTDKNIGVQCANCGDSPIWQVINGMVVTGGTSGKDNVFQIANTDLPDTLKLRYCPTGSSSNCRDLAFSRNYLVVDNGRLADFRPFYFLNKLAN